MTDAPRFATWIDVEVPGDNRRMVQDPQYFDTDTAAIADAKARGRRWGHYDPQPRPGVPPFTRIG